VYKVQEFEGTDSPLAAISIITFDENNMTLWRSEGNRWASYRFVATDGTLNLLGKVQKSTLLYNHLSSKVVDIEGTFQGHRVRCLSFPSKGSV